MRRLVCLLVLLVFAGGSHASALGLLWTCFSRFDLLKDNLLTKVTSRAAESPMSVRSVLGDFDPDYFVYLAGANSYAVNDAAVSLKTRWAKSLTQAIASSNATAREKVAAYAKLVAEIERRSGAIEDAYYDAHPLDVKVLFTPWKAKKADAGGGVTVFAGGNGYMVEIRPDGTVYFVAANDATDPDESGWKPPYKNGIPNMQQIRERNRVSPTP